MGTETKKFDEDKLTIGEAAKIEKLAGLGIGTFSDPTAPKALLLGAIVHVWSRRNGPGNEISWPAANEMSLTECAEYLGVQDPEDADEAEDAPDPT